MNLPQRASRHLDLLVAALLGVVSLALYVKTLAPTLLMADSAEFQFACYLGGIAHPTGYPLYLMLGWLWSHLLPLGDVAYRINLLCALFSAIAVGLMYRLSLQVLRVTFDDLPSPLLRAAAVVATLTLAFSRTFWSQALRAEVYALNSLFVVATLSLLLRWARPQSRSRATLYLAALVYGLSLTHHRTMILFLPACVVFVWLTDRSVLTDLRSLGRLLALVLVPQLLYLYIPWRAPATPYLHVYLGPGRQLELYENTVQGFLGFVMGSMFRGELGYQASLLERLAMAWDFLVRQFGLAGIVLGVLGVVRLGMPRRGAGTRHAVSLQHRVLLLLGLSYLGVVTFCLFYFIGDIHALFTPSYVIFAIFIGLGMAWIMQGLVILGQRLGSSLRSRRFRDCVLVLLFALLPVSLLVNNYHRVDKTGDYRARQMWDEILAQPIPQGAILVSNDRNEITPLLYLQQVEGLRPDLVGLFPLILPGEGYSNTVRVIDSVIDVERPIYLIKEMPGLEIKYRLEHFVPLVQVLGPAMARPPAHPTNLSLNDSLVLVGYDLEPETPTEGQELRVTFYWYVQAELAENYHSYVHLLDEAGNVVAQSDHRAGGEYYPTSLWRPGETLVDRHDLGSAPGAPPAEYELQAGMYRYPSLEALGGALHLGQATVHRPGD